MNTPVTLQRRAKQMTNRETYHGVALEKGERRRDRNRVLSNTEK